jgi:hypothetical protein
MSYNITSQNLRSPREALYIIAHYNTNAMFHRDNSVNFMFNTLNAELNPICHLLALLEAHYILHVSTKRVNTLRQLQKSNVLYIKKSH